MGHKNGKITDEEYTKILRTYENKLENNKDKWLKILHRDKLLKLAAQKQV